MGEADPPDQAGYFIDHVRRHGERAGGKFRYADSSDKAIQQLLVSAEKTGQTGCHDIPGHTGKGADDQKRSGIDRLQVMGMTILAMMPVVMVLMATVFVVVMTMAWGMIMPLRVGMARLAGRMLMVMSVFGAVRIVLCIAVHSGCPFEDSASYSR